MFEYRQQEIRRHVTRELTAAGLLVRGHVDYGNGHHGRSYVDVPGLLERPSLVWRLAEHLVDLVPAESRVAIEIVGGITTAGLILAHTMAGLLDGRRPLDRPACRFVAFETDRLGRPMLAPRACTHLRGHAILLVSDWGAPGGALETCTDLARDAGATVLARAAIGEWPGPRVLEGPLVVTLCDWIRRDGVPAAHCPLCRADDSRDVMRDTALVTAPDIITPPVRQRSIP